MLTVCNSRQTRCKAAAEEIMAIYDHLRVRGLNVHSIGKEILDMVASAAGSIQVSRDTVSHDALSRCSSTKHFVLRQDMDKLEAVLSDSKKCGFDASLAMDIAFLKCHSAQGDTDNALQVLGRCVLN